MRPESCDQDDHGCLPDPPGGKREPAAANRVRHRGVPAGEPHRIGAVLVTVLAPVLTAVLLWHLVRPAGRTRRTGGGWPAVLDGAALASTACAALCLLLAVALPALATLVARDPVPVRPPSGLRAALVVTYVPGREPLDAVRTTLLAALRLRREGPLDVWLLDEGDEPAARALCADIGARHFSRRGVPEWNRPAGAHRAGTRHGNRNAWLAMYGDCYDVLACARAGEEVLPHFLERTLGHFRDPDVAFVVGPRSLRDAAGTPPARAAEAQALVLQTLFQRAANRRRAPLLAGAAVVRTAALRQAGGFVPCGADDLATGVEIHRRRNPATGGHWCSVHTAEILAVGPGPASWPE
ncbi:glycosyl transferase, partial [Streptomyces fuscigenes]